MLPFHRFLLTFRLFFCRIKRYKGKFCPLFLSGCCILLLCSGCKGQESPSPTPTTTAAPPVTNEDMRGVWLSYIELDEMLAGANPTTAAESIAAAMDVCADNGINTVFFHLRAHGDAYYPSAVWPAATTAQAVMAAGFDPLACAIEEAHKRGIALHGWLNPYRLGGNPIEGISFEKAGTWYLDPANPAARQTVLDGVREILATYDVDGIHFDDYFYPAGMAKGGEPFEVIPADTNVTAWRQTQVDALVSGTYSLCRQYGKPFGISPAANNERNRTEAYANVERWMTEAGYVDYVCPQIYTGFRHQTRPFLTVLEEWLALPRRDGIHLYVGLALYKVGLSHDPYAGSGATEWITDADIIPRQIAATKDKTDGYVLFRYGNLI